MPTSVSAEGILTPIIPISQKVFRLFLDKTKLHIRMNILSSFTRLPTELAENRQVCSPLPPSKKGVGLCLILLPFQSYGFFIGRKHPRSEYQTLGGCRKKNKQHLENRRHPF